MKFLIRNSALCFRHFPLPTPQYCCAEELTLAVGFRGDSSYPISTLAEDRRVWCVLYPASSVPHQLCPPLKAPLSFRHPVHAAASVCPSDHIPSSHPSISHRDQAWNMVCAISLTWCLQCPGHPFGSQNLTEHARTSPSGSFQHS